MILAHAPSRHPPFVYVDKLMGMSTHGISWFPACYSKASLEYIVKHWGINVIRAAMYEEEGNGDEEEKRDRQTDKRTEERDR